MGHVAALVPHWRAAVDVLRYLSAKREYGIAFGGRGALKLQAWRDSGCGGDLDTRRSTPGYGSRLVAGPPPGSRATSQRLQPQWWARSTWRLRRQPRRGSGCAPCCKPLLSAACVCRHVGRGTMCISIQGDNQGAIILLRNPASFSRAKHIDMHQHFVRERVAHGDAQLTYMPTLPMMADALTCATMQV
jgi:hypothetical protein